MSFYPDFIQILSKFYPDFLETRFILIFSNQDKIWIKGHGRDFSSKFLTSVDRMGLFDDQVAMVQSDSGSTVRLLKMAKHFRYFFFLQQLFCFQYLLYVSRKLLKFIAFTSAKVGTTDK